MASEVPGQPVQHRLDLRLVGKPARVPVAERGEERMAESVVGEDPVQVAAGNASVGGDGAISAAVGEAREGPRPVRPLGATDVHLIAPELGPAVGMPHW